MNVLPLLLSIVLQQPAFCAQTPEEKGLAVFREAEKRDDGFRNARAEMTMTLRNRRGDESVRRMRMRTLEVTDDGDKSLIIFDNPKDVKGTAFLTFTHKKGNDDQWLYLPALKRVKRISASNRSGSFMGSEFSYEDLSSWEVEKYAYTWLREEACPSEEFEELRCDVVESYPADKKSGYTRIVSWIDAEEYRNVRSEFYDRKSSRLKTLTPGGYERYLDKFWRPLRMEMVNHQTGKSTELRWRDYRFRTGLKDSDFDRNALKRAK
ncbi:MAG: outer membrane lipoprotein-sorting protein [Elusimicrobiota bacterium]